MNQEKALEFYEKHRERVKKYNQEKREQINEAMKQHYKCIKEDEVKYKEYLEKKRKYYHEKKQNNNILKN